MLEELIHARLTDRLLDRAAEGLRAYFRLECEGLENIPRKGPALVIPNHSGFAAADAIMISHLIHHDQGRIPKILAHRAFFDWSRVVRRAALAFGLEKVSVEHGVELLREDELLLVFPEGEAGNFKSSLKRYQLQPFHTGFVRMAIKARAPVIPCLVVGAEETHLNAGSLDLSSRVPGLKLPIPLTLLPLPARWRVRFLRPIDLREHRSRSADSKAFCEALASRIRARMQRALAREVARRKHVYL